MATAAKKPAVKPATKSTATKKPANPSTAPSPAKKPVSKTPDPKTSAIKALVGENKDLMEKNKELLAKKGAVGIYQTSAQESLPVTSEETCVTVERPTLEQEETEVEVELAKDIFLIAKPLCMSCVHLSPETGTESPTNCHFSLGNEECPARITLIQVGMSRKEIDKAARAIVEATAVGDFERLNNAAQRLATKSESARVAVATRVLELQKETTAA